MNFQRKNFIFGIIIIIIIIIINITTTIKYSTTSDFTLKALKPISDEYKLIAEKIIDSFTGDASFFAYNGEEAAEDPEGPPVERFREQDRLSYTVAVYSILLLILLLYYLILIYKNIRKLITTVQLYPVDHMLLMLAKR